MRKLITLIAFICFCANANAQYVNIPDSNFRNILISKYPSCFNSAKQMDTSCSLILQTDSITCKFIYGIKSLTGIEFFKNLKYLDCNGNKLTNLPTLPNRLTILDCSDNQITNLPTLPDSLTILICFANQLTSLPKLPNNLIELNCFYNQITYLPTLPNHLTTLICTYNQLTNLPTLPNRLTILDCSDNQITNLPTLPDSLTFLDCNYNQLTNLPTLNRLIRLSCNYNKNLSCLPWLPNSLQYLYIDSTQVSCLPNNHNFLNLSLPICNPINNINHCQSFPTIQSYGYTDINKNNKQDTNEYPKHNLKLTLSNNNYTYTNTQGIAQINADSKGTYTITAQAPPLYNAVPASYTHNFNSYDTLVLDTFALQPIVIKDSLAIKITSFNFAARPGFNYVYNVNIENVGTTIVNPTINVMLDTSKYIFDSTSNSNFSFSGNTLQGSFSNVYPAQNINFYVYGRLKTNATLGSSLMAIANATGGTANAIDTIITTIRGSYDPNDKQATTNLSVAQVADNAHWIDYTIRFQNTGTDTAFTVVVADTLNSSKLQINTLELTQLSHKCKVTQNDNIVFFEFRDINLPDSNTNKMGSNGFVSFRVKPLTTLINGNIVPNKAAIYFDYNSPVITNTANTIIGSPLPLTLTAFGAIPKEDINKILVYWNTANEVNTHYFIIEQSLNGKDFKAIAEVAAIGKGNNSYYYNIAQNNVQYVRLKMIDKNGTFIYSNIIRITTNDKQQTINVISPAKNELKINVFANNLHNTKAVILNAQGKIVKQFLLKKGFTNIDIAALPRGVYYIKTSEGSVSFVVE